MEEDKAVITLVLILGWVALAALLAIPTFATLIMVLVAAFSLVEHTRSFLCRLIHHGRYLRLDTSNHIVYLRRCTKCGAGFPPYD